MAGKGGMPSLRETLRGHLRAGHRIALVLPRYDLFSDQPVPLPVRRDAGYEVIIAPCRWLPAIKGLRAAVRRLLGRQELPFAVRWLTNLLTFLLLGGSLYLAAMRRARRGRPVDLVYAHNQYAAGAGWLIARALGVPNVTRLYGTFLAELMARPLVRLRYPVAAAGFDVPSALLICTNDGTRGDEVAARLGVSPSRFRFWANGVDPPAAPPSGDRRQFLRRAPANLRGDSCWVVSCSRLDGWKRIDRLLRGLRAARRAGADVQLLVAGDGSQRDRLRRLADELRIADDVVWLGVVAHEHVWELMHVADAFAITNDVTNRCNPLYEAICAHLPVVSVTDASTADLLADNDNALLVGKDDDEALGRCLARVCTDGGLAEAMRRAQRRRAAALWTWTQRLDAELAELERLVRTADVR
jgi:glycosyltransferase involved in cell wall biosynthesis